MISQLSPVKYSPMGPVFTGEFPQYFWGVTILVGKISQLSPVADTPMVEDSSTQVVERRAPGHNALL